MTATNVCADDAVDLGQVVVTDTGKPVASRRLADNTTRVDTDHLDLIGATHPAQIFTAVPGAWVTQGGGQESLMALRSPLLTGPGACGAFLLLEDGIPIQPAGFCNDNALFELDTEQAMAVEVIRGPGSVLYGGNAVHGIINVLIQPADFVPADSARLELGSHHYSRAEASLGDWDGNSGLRVAANATHDGGFRALSGFDQQKLDLRLDRSDGAVSRETMLAVTNLRQDTAGYIFGPDAYKDASVRDSNPTPGAFRNAQSWLAAQRWQVMLDAARELDLTPYVRRNAMAFVQHYIPGEPIETHAQDSLGAMLALRTQLSPATAVIYGVDSEYAHGSLTEFQAQALTTGTPQQNATRPQGLHYDYAADSRTLAGYIHFTRQWDPHWIFTGGLRVEAVRYSYENFLPVGDTQADGTPCGFGGCLFNRPADRRDQFVNLLPKFGLSWLVTDSQTLYADLGRGARAPQTTELYELQQQQTVTDLRPETLDSAELGWRGNTGAFDWNTDMYYMLKQHFIFRDANGFNVDDGRTRHRGVEFKLDWRMSETLNFTLDGSYARHSYAFSTVLMGGNAIAYGNDVKYAPRSLGSVWFTWRMDAATRLEVQYLHVGGYWLDESNQHRYGGHDLLNLYLQRGFERGYSFTFRVINAADSAYAERADYAFGNYRYFPGDGREFFLELDKDW